MVVYAALRLIGVAEYRRLARFRRSELILAVATTAAVLGLGVPHGVLRRTTALCYAQDFVAEHWALDQNSGFSTPRRT